MKSKSVLSILLCLLLLIGCENNESSFLEDDDQRQEIYAEILNNHTYMKEFMDSIRSNNHARMMMNYDTSIISSMMHHAPADVMIKGLMDRTTKDSTACKMMCGMMMEHKKVRKAMLETLDEKGVVKKGCMTGKEGEFSLKANKLKHH
jgi:hypothetical protein